MVPGYLALCGDGGVWGAVGGCCCWVVYNHVPGRKLLTNYELTRSGQGGIIMRNFEASDSYPMADKFRPLKGYHAHWLDGFCHPANGPWSGPGSVPQLGPGWGAIRWFSKTFFPLSHQNMEIYPYVKNPGSPGAAPI